MNNLQDFSKSVIEQITKDVQEGSTGSFLTNVLGSSDLHTGYNSAVETENEVLKEYEDSLKEGKVDTKLCIKAGFFSGLTKSLSSRYASRKTLFKTGYDRKIADAIYIDFCDKTSDDINNLPLQTTE